MMGKKGQLLNYSIWIISSLILIVALRVILPCINTSLAFVGILLLVAGIMFGFYKKWSVSVISLLISAILLILSYFPCVS